MEATFRSYAKINLGLILRGNRKDGYHNIETLFQLIDLHDTLVFKRTESDSIRLSCTDASVPLDSTNLIHKAYAHYKKTCNIQGGLDVAIEKRIPAGGGLGGGSSNAAVTFRACEYLWQLKTSKQLLHRMALEIGSDVPFFLLGGAALGQGRGDELTPLTFSKPLWVVLVCPGFSVSTKWAYSQAKIGLTNAEKISKLRAIFSETEVHTWRETLVNELESVVISRHPELHKIKMQLYKKDAFYAGMSGSGSTMYGLFHDRTTAERAIAFFSMHKMKALLARSISGPFPQEEQESNDHKLEDSDGNH